MPRKDTLNDLSNSYNRSSQLTQYEMEQKQKEDDEKDRKVTKAKELEDFKVRYSRLPEKVQSAIMLAQQKKKYTDFYYKM